MDFTTTPPSNSLLPIEASPISSIPCSTKLPIKRKTLTPPKLELSTTQNDDVPTPFKFHRIWTDPDEIRLLQGLLDCSLQGYSFPRDLGIFYNQYSNGMSQPYSKSQLSEKLRRLRKKFRIISARINKGLDRSQLSPQDRALFDLSDQLWGAGKANLSVRGNTNLPINRKPVDESKRKANAVGVSSNLPNLPSTSTAVLALPVIKKTENGDNGGKSDKVDGESGGFKDYSNGKCDVNDEVEGGDVNVELVANVKRSLGDELRSGIVRFATTTLGDVLDQSLKEMRRMVDVKRCSEMEKEVGFEKRWRDQRIAEFDVLAKRLKLVLERSSMVIKLGSIVSCFDGHSFGSILNGVASKLEVLMLLSLLSKKCMQQCRFEQNVYSVTTTLLNMYAERGNCLTVWALDDSEKIQCGRHLSCGTCEMNLGHWF